MFRSYMRWIPCRPAYVLGLTVALSGVFGFSPVAAQTSSARPTASAASSEDAPDTAGPRRRPTRRTATPDSVRIPAQTVSNRASAAVGSVAARSAMVAATLRLEGQDWIGIPYRWGGESRRGIDCSAFTQQFVRATLGIELPRATAGQQYEGIGVAKDELLPGDLVFFRRRGVRHVGVYLGQNEFIHASSSRGVMVSDLDHDYWSRYYWMARRVQTEPSSRRPTPRSSARGDTATVRG